MLLDNLFLQENGQRFHPKLMYTKKEKISVLKKSTPYMNFNILNSQQQKLYKIHTFFFLMFRET